MFKLDSVAYDLLKKYTTEPSYKPAKVSADGDVRHTDFISDISNSDEMTDVRHTDSISDISNSDEMGDVRL